MGNSLSSLGRETWQLKLDFAPLNYDFWPFQNNEETAQLDKQISQMKGKPGKKTNISNNNFNKSLSSKKRKESPVKSTNIELSTNANTVANYNNASENQLQNRKKVKSENNNNNNIPSSNAANHAGGAWTITPQDIFSSLTEYSTNSHNTRNNSNKSEKPMDCTMGLNNPIETPSKRSSGLSLTNTVATQLGSPLSPFSNFNSNIIPSPSTAGKGGVVNASRASKYLAKLLSVPARKTVQNNNNSTTPSRNNATVSATKPNNSNSNTNNNNKTPFKNILSLDSIKSPIEQKQPESNNNVQNSSETSSSSDIPMAPPLEIVTSSTAPIAPILSNNGTINNNKTSNNELNSTNKTKKLHWQALAAMETENTVFTEIDNNNALFDLTELQSTFSAKQGKILHRTSVNLSQAPLSVNDNNNNNHELPYQSFVDSKRCYNIDISLAQFRVSHDSIRDNIINMNYQAFTKEQLNSLHRFSPTKQELARLKELLQKQQQQQSDNSNSNNNDITAYFNNVEKYFHRISSIYRVSERLEIMNYISEFNENINEINNNLSLIEESCKEIRNSTSIKTILLLILQLGNLLNNTNNKGFNLSSINKLKHTKSADNSITLLHYLVNYIMENNINNSNSSNNNNQNNNVLKLSTELSSVVEASKIDYNTLHNEIKQLKQGLDTVKNELTIIKRAQTINNNKHSNNYNNQDFTNQLSIFINKTSEFYSIANVEIDNMLDRIECVLSTSLSLSKYFGESNITDWNQLFSLFAEFIANFEQTQKEIIEKKEKASTNNNHNSNNSNNNGENILKERMANRRMSICPESTTNIKPITSDKENSSSSINRNNNNSNSTITNSSALKNKESQLNRRQSNNKFNDSVQKQINNNNSTINVMSPSKMLNNMNTEFESVSSSYNEILNSFDPLS